MTMGGNKEAAEDLKKGSKAVHRKGKSNAKGKAEGNSRIGKPTAMQKHE